MTRAPAFIAENAARFDDAEPKACVRGCPIHSSMPCEGCRFNYALVQHLRLRAVYARRPLLKDKAILYFCLVLFYASAGFLVIAFFLLPPGNYKAKLIDVIVDGDVVTQKLELEDGSTIDVTSRADSRFSDEAVDRLKARVADTIRDAAQKLDIAANTMRQFENYFSEDDFDELGRVVGQLALIAERAKS